MRSIPARQAFVIGLMASAISAAVMIILRFITGGLTLPEVLVDAVTRVIPLSLFSVGVGTLGPWAKRLLAAGLAIILFLLGGLVSIGWQWSTRRHGPGKDRVDWLRTAALAIVLWLLTMVVLLPASRRGVFALSVSPWPAAMVLSWLVSAAAFSVALAVVSKRAERPAAPRRGMPDVVTSTGLSRRDFVKRLGWILGGVVVASAAGASIWRFVLSAPSKLLSFSGQSMTSEITPEPDFYVVAKDIVPPSVNATTWKLDIGGMVNTPLTLSYDQLKARPSVRQYQTLECISNPIGGNLISNALWNGVRLADLLDQTGMKATAKKVVLYAADGYTDSITLSEAMDPGTVLAYEMSGVALPVEHGYPVRLLVPNIYGMKNVKWLNRIELVDYDYQGYWEQQGWSDIAEILTMSRIDIPANGGDYVLPQETGLGGIAFAGGRGISWVELSMDGGNTWSRAVLKRPLSQFTWVLWTYDWKAPQEGTYHLVVRAADGTGAVQTERRSAPLPNGATGYDEVTIRLLEPAFPSGGPTTTPAKGGLLTP